jgi:large subunit ribosomal protein L32
MAVPKTKTSKQRTNTRYAQWKISAPNLSECPQCHELKASHKVCPKCGYYDGTLVVDVQAKEKKN